MAKALQRLPFLPQNPTLTCIIISPYAIMFLRLQIHHIPERKMKESLQKLISCYEARRTVARKYKEFQIKKRRLGYDDVLNTLL